jgi:hypothetical protein
MWKLLSKNGLAILKRQEVRDHTRLKRKEKETNR